MTQSRLFANQQMVTELLSKRGDVIDAFKSGQFSPEVINYLKAHHVATLVSNLPKDTNFITLSPQIFALNQAKLMEIFQALPEHVKVVNLNLVDLQNSQLARFKGLMAHSGYAKNTSVFNLGWDFHRYPMATLQSNILSRAIPRQLTNFNFTHGPDIERVCEADLAKFKETKLAADTQVHLDTHYHLRHRCG